MSSFICSPKHFNSIEWNVREMLNTKNDFDLPYDAQKVFTGIYKSSWKKHEPQQVNEIVKNLINDLRKINVLCVTLQYKEHYAGKVDQEIETQTEILTGVGREEKPVILTPLGLYNSLNCVKYQIEIEHLTELRELNANEERAMYFLKVLIDELAKYIVSKLPEDKNTWSIN
jgi:hypothetical protein